MKVILMQDVKGKGKKGQMIEVSSAYVIKVIGKRTDSMINSIRIPTAFEFNSVALNLLLLEQVFDVDR